MFGRIYRLGLIILFGMLLVGCTREDGEALTKEESVTEKMSFEETSTTGEVLEVHNVNPEVLALYVDYRKENPDRNYFTPSTEKVDGVEYTVYTNGDIEVRNSAKKEIRFSNGELENPIRIDYIDEEMPYLEVYGCDLTGDGIEEIICHWDGTGSNLGGDRMLVIDSDTLEEIPYIDYSSSGVPALAEDMHNWFNGVYVYLRYETVTRRSFNCDIVDGKLAIYRITEDEKYKVGCYLEYNKGCFIKGEEFVKCLEGGTYTDIEVPENLTWELDFKDYYYGYNTFEEYDFYVYERMVDGAPMYCYEHRDEAEDITFLVTKDQMRGSLIHGEKQVSFDIYGILTGTSGGGAIEYKDVTGDGRKDFIYHEWGGTGASGETRYVIYDVEHMEEYKQNLECTDIVEQISIEPKAIVGNEEDSYYIEYELNVDGEVYNTYRWIGGADNAERMDIFNQAKEECGVYNTAYANFYDGYAYAAIYVSDRGTKLGSIYIDIIFDEENNIFILDKNSLKVHVYDYPQIYSNIQSKDYFVVTTETIDETEYIIYTNGNITVKANNRNNNFEFSNGSKETIIEADYYDKNNAVMEVYGYDLTEDGVDEIICWWIPNQTLALGERMFILDSETLEKIDYIEYSKEGRPLLSEEEHSWMNAVLLHLGYATVYDKTFSCGVIDGRLAIYRITEDERYMTGYYLEYKDGAFVKSERFTMMELDNGYYTDIEVPDNLSWQLAGREDYYNFNSAGFYNDFAVSEIIIDGVPMYCFAHKNKAEDIIFLVNEIQNEGTLIHNDKQVTFPIEIMISATDERAQISYEDVTGDGRKEFVYCYSIWTGYSYNTEYKIYDVETMEEYKLDMDCTDIIENMSFEAVSVVEDVDANFYIEFELRFYDEVHKLYRKLDVTGSTSFAEELNKAKEYCGIHDVPYATIDSDSSYATISIYELLNSIGYVRVGIVFDENNKNFKIDESAITLELYDIPQIKEMEVPAEVLWQLNAREFYSRYNSNLGQHGFTVSEKLIDGVLMYYFRYHDEAEDITFLVNEGQTEGTLIHNGKQVTFPIVIMLSGLFDSGHINYMDVTGDGRKDFVYHYSGGSGSHGYTEYKIYDIDTMEEYIIDSGDIADRISLAATGVAGNKTDGYYMNYEVAFADKVFTMSGMLYNGITDKSDVDLEAFAERVIMSVPYAGYSEENENMYIRYVFTRGSTYIGDICFDLVFDEMEKKFVVDEDSVW